MCEMWGSQGETTSGFGDLRRTKVFPSSQKTTTFWPALSFVVILRR